MPDMSKKRLPLCLMALAISLPALFFVPVRGESEVVLLNQEEQIATRTTKEALVTTVLTYNVHGLPAIVAWDSPRRRMSVISGRFNSYPLVLAQEDFAYHDHLAKNARHSVIMQGNAIQGRFSWIRSLFCGSCGSGLTTFSTFPLIAKTAHPFLLCNGVIGSANDCWATKGYLMTRIAWHNGAEVDVYNLHLDAGPWQADRNTRAKQLENVANAIEILSPARAVIVGGDFNLNASDPREMALMHDFAHPLNLVDSGARPKNQTTLHFDYILFRSGEGAELRRLESGEAEAFTEDGQPMSDHSPLFAKFLIKPR